MKLLVSHTAPIGSVDIESPDLSMAERPVPDKALPLTPHVDRRLWITGHRDVHISLVAHAIGKHGRCIDYLGPVWTARLTGPENVPLPLRAEPLAVAVVLQPLSVVVEIHHRNRPQRPVFQVEEQKRLRSQFTPYGPELPALAPLDVLHPRV